MASNSFGQLFRITTFGESHGPGIGVVIDGCPAGLPVTAADIQLELSLRRPGHTRHTSPRKEQDTPEILSGVFQGLTTGAPIAIFIRNLDADSSQYSSIENLYRPGHANFSYLAKYGHMDPRGGGRASARETAARVAAGAIAKKLLSYRNIECAAFVSEIGGIAIDEIDLSNLSSLRETTYASPVFCPCPRATKKMVEKLTQIQEDNDSVGGIITGVAQIPSGLGEPIYCKLEALLASAMLSIPASKGFEIGAGFAAARMKGSEHNDPFHLDAHGRPCPATNFAGGTLGGLSSGAPLHFRVAFKPTSSIKKPQQTVNLQGDPAIFQLPENARHDPCVAIRAVPIIETMTALVLADLVLMNQTSTIQRLLLSNPTM